MTDKETIEDLISKSISSGRVLWSAGVVPGIANDIYVINTVAYVADKELGRGASGAVHLVHHWKTGKRQAIKVQKRSRQANAQMQISHIFMEALVARDETNSYIVLPYYEMSLATWHSRHCKRGGDEVGTIRTLRKSAESLQVIHDKGFVHLDIKSNNIMMSEDGIVTVIDFGRTKKRGEIDVGFGMPLDTEHYLPPEIMTSNRFSVDFSNDIWSLGQMFNLMNSVKRIHHPEFAPLVRSMLSINQHSRPQLHDVVASLRNMEAGIRKTLQGLPPGVPFGAAPLPAPKPLFVQPAAPTGALIQCQPFEFPQMKRSRAPTWFWR